MLGSLKKFQLWLSMLVLLVVPVALGAQTVSVRPCSFGISGTPWDCGLANSKGAGLPEGKVINIIAAGLSWMLAVLGFLAIIAFVISGILYLTSAGNEGQAETAKNAMKYAIIGVIVALVGYVAIQAIESLLRAEYTF